MDSAQSVLTIRRDIASLLDYIKSDMKELDSSRIAVMGGSCELIYCRYLYSFANLIDSKMVVTWCL